VNGLYRRVQEFYKRVHGSYGRAQDSLKTSRRFYSRDGEVLDKKWKGFYRGGRAGSTEEMGRF
jgi:hypothetical protein